MTKRMGALCALAAFVLDRASRWSSRKVGGALLYHRVHPGPLPRNGQLVPVVSSEEFEAQARHLLRRYRVVPASELPSAVAGRRRGGPFPITITFDDDLASHAEIAAPILAGLGVPATFFLCGASLEGPHSPWWEDLQRAVDAGFELPVLPTASGERSEPLPSMAARIEEMSPTARAHLAEELRRRVGPGPHDSGIRVDQVRSLVTAGFEIGFHTRFHDPLDTLDDGDLDRALTLGRSELESITAAPIAAIAYPHGRADTRVAGAARSAGYSIGFTTAGNLARPSSDQLLLGRIDPSGLAPERFALMLSRKLSAPQPAS